MEDRRVDGGLGILHARGAEICTVQIEECEVECCGGGGWGHVGEVYEGV